MAVPTTEATNLQASLISSQSFRLNFTKGDGARRLISITSGTVSVSYPDNNLIYEGSLKYGYGYPLTTQGGVGGTCSTGTVSTATYSSVSQSQSSSSSSTYVVYEGLSDGTVGLDIINLDSGKEYQIMVLEHNDYCYLPSEILSVVTTYPVNREDMDITVFDNRTRLPLEGAQIAIKNRNGFISDFGTTDSQGKYKTLLLDEGRYEMSVISNGYEGKQLSGLFIQRVEPRRADYSNPYGTWGETATYDSSNTRKRLTNNNNYTIFLDPLNTTNSSFAKYQSNNYPSHLTKI